MTKKIRATFLIFFTSLFCLALFAGLSVYSLRTVKADGETPLNDYSFESGAAIRPLGADDAFAMELGFNIKTNDPTKRDVEKMGWHEQRVNVVGTKKRPQSWFRFDIVLYRENSDTSSTPISVLTVYLQRWNDKDWYDMARIVAKKDYLPGEGTLYFDEYTASPEGTTGAFELDWGQSPVKELFVNGDKMEMLEVWSINNGGLIFDGEEEIRVVAKVPSPYQTYYVQLNYTYHYVTGWSWPAGSHYTHETGTARSDSRSFYYVANAVNNDDLLDVFFEEPHAEKIREIIKSPTVKDVKIKYLEQIGDTPFAHSVEKTVKVPVVSGGVYADDIFAYLGVNNLNVVDSYAQKFERDANISDLYVAKYYTSAWLRAVTVDGNYIDYFSDFNKSYEEYFGGYVQRGVIQQGLYEWIFDKLLIAKYPDVGKYTPDEVYGLWGFAVVPETYSLNSLWAEMFRAKTDKGNLTSCFEYQSLITFEEYSALQEEYDYTWLQRAWSGIAGFVSGGTWQASYYIFYAEPGTEVSWIDQSGENDEEGIKDKDQEGNLEEEVKDDLEDIKEITDGAWDSITGLFKGIFNNTGTMLLSGVIIAGVVVGVILIVKKLKDNNNDE